MQKNLVIDLSNLVWITRYSKNIKEDFTKDVLMHGVFNAIKFISMDYKPDGILIACDSPNVWRKDLYEGYKAHRDDLRDDKYEEVKQVIIELGNFFKNNTSIPAISVKKAEADDIIAVATRISTQNNIIVSNDKDFIQLINDKTKLYSPTTREERTTQNKDFELFEKCIRGDAGDNIPSAFPRVRKTKLEEAYKDPLIMVNLMETKRKLDGKRVSDVFDFNKKLIDLSKIPKDIYNTIENEIRNNANGYSKYNQLKVLKFFGDNNLINVAKDEKKYASLFKKRFLL